MTNIFRTLTPQISFIEHPKYISLTFVVSGCPLRCPGCHSTDLYNPTVGQLLTIEQLEVYLNEYASYIQNVVFLGGDWNEEHLLKCLKKVQEYGLKRTLYTGFDNISLKLKNNLEYVKYGAYIERLGGLTSPTTNQRLIDLHVNEDITYLFRR
ncbi:MAG: 4Fe-4S cluster-binding domain-containing protein [Mycoplasmatales bacterium]